MENIPLYLYHATPKRKLGRIKKQGLVPGKKKNWEDSSPSKIYLATDPEIAYDFVINSDIDLDEEEKIAIIEINTLNLDKDLFNIDQNIQFYEDEPIYSYEYEGVIPPDSFTNITFEEV